MTMKITKEEDISTEIFYQAIADRAVRCRDPLVALQGRWVVRRLAPDCSRIELGSLPAERFESLLLHAMGWETGNIHLGSAAIIKEVKQDLKRRNRNWLLKAAEAMESATRSDWEDWKKTGLHLTA